MSEKTRRGRNHLSPWTVKEMSYLENNYGKFSAQEIGDTLGRSAGAVRGLARKLGLSTPRPPTWTEEELALIRVNYCRGLAFVQALLPERTFNAIRIQASLMGVTNPYWSDEELRYLEVNHGSVPISKIAASLGRSAKGVANMVRKMGLAKRPATGNVPWTEQELAILRAHYGAGAWIMRVQALLPGRTKGAIGIQAHNMGIREPLSWQPYEISILQKYYPKIGTAVAERLPGRTVAAIKTQAVRLGFISRSRTPNKVWTPEELKRLEDNISLTVDNLMKLFPDCTRHALVYMRNKINEKGKPSKGGNKK